MRTSPEVLVAMFDVEINLVSDFRSLSCLYGLCAEQSSNSEEDKSKRQTPKHFEDEGKE